MADDDVETAIRTAVTTQQPDVEQNAIQADDKTEPPFSIFTLKEKWALIAMAAVAGFFSPMSANIYFPAIPLLSQDFHTSISLMNLTVTVYLIFQGVSPMLWAPLSDLKGRRPIYLTCLALLSITCVALALTPTDKWWLLIVFRCFQASGSASTAVLGNGVVADIATPAERGGFIGLAVVGPLIGPCLGPILGGILAGNLGWRWIFWFLCILSTTCLAFIFLFFPETLRRVVGNGSILAPWWDRPIVPIIGPYKRSRRHLLSQQPSLSTSSPSKLRINPFLFFKELDVILMLLANGLVYCVLVSMQATTSLLFQQAYPYLTQTDIGLCFLPMGAGCLGATLVNGKLLDWQYRKDRAIWDDERRRNSEKPDAPISKDAELTFPLEKARLRWAMTYTVLVAAVGVGFGWTLDRKVQLAVPLIFQFIAGWAVVGQMNSFQTLLIDIFPKQGSSTTAINNFVRCLLGAGVVSAINPILDAIGTGWTYVLLSGICILCTPTFTWLAWERHLDITFQPAPPYPDIEWPSCYNDWVFGQSFAASVQAEHKLLYTLQVDLREIIDVRRKTSRLESKWLEMSPEARETHITKSLVVLCSSRIDLEDRRKWCPETRMRFLEEGGGKGFLNLLAIICPRNSGREPLSRPIFVQNPVFEAMQLVPGPPEENKEVQQLLWRSVAISRNIFLTYFLYSTVLGLYGEKLEHRPIKPAAKSSDTTQVLRTYAPDAFKTWRQATKAVRSSAERACAACDTVASALPDGKSFMQCPKCKAIGRKIVYCNKECQLNDWKNGIPPHKQICGKPLSVPDAVAPTPIVSETYLPDDSESWLPPADPGFVRSQALRRQLYRLHLTPNVVYYLRRPQPADPEFLTLLKIDCLPIYLFEAHKARAIKNGDPQAVALMFLILEEVSRIHRFPKADILRQLSEEYGVDVATIERLSNPDGDPDAYSEALQRAAESAFENMLAGYVEKEGPPPT